MVQPMVGFCHGKGVMEQLAGEALTRKFRVKEKTSFHLESKTKSSTYPKNRTKTDQLKFEKNK